MLDRVLDNMVKAGIGDLVVNVHHFASQVVDHVANNGRNDVRVRVSDESPLLLDTGGGLLKAAGLLWPDADLAQEDVLLHNADILTDVNLGAMCEAHKRSGADVTLLVSARQSSRMLYFDECGQMRGWMNQKTGETKPEGFVPAGFTPLAFGGVHVVSPRIKPMLEKYADAVGPVFSIMPFYLDNLQDLNVRSFVVEGDYMWHDVGSPEKYSAAEAAIARRQTLRD